MSANQPGCQRFDLDVLLQALRRLDDPTGSVTLHIGDGVRERVMYFVQGGVRVLARGDGADLGLARYLLGRFLLDAETLDQLIALSRERNVGLRDLLEERGHVSRGDLQEIARSLVRDEVFGLVFWNEAFCSLADQPPREIYSSASEVLVAQVDCHAFAHEVTQWVQLWSRSRRLLGSKRTRIVPTARRESPPDDLSAAAQALLELCDQEIALYELWCASACELPEVCVGLLELVEHDLVSVCSADRSKAESRRELAAVAEQIESSVSMFLAPLLARERLVQCRRELEENHRVVHELHLLARDYLAIGRWESGVERLREIVEREAENLEAHEAHFRALVEHGQAKRAISFAKSRAERFVAERLFEEASSVARFLGTIPEGRAAALAIEADVLAGSGETESAVERYAEGVDALAATGERGRARELAEKAVGVDRSNPVLAEKLRELTAAAACLEPGQVAASDRGARRFVRGRLRLGWRAAPVFVALVALIALTIGLISGFSRLSRERTAAAASAANASDAIDGGAPEPASTTWRELDERWAAEWVDGGDFVLVDRWSGKQVARLAGREDERWSVGFRARRVCQWKPGELPRIHALPDGGVSTPVWSLPDDAEAVAVGDGVLAICHGDRTVVRAFGAAGAALRERALPRWSHGVFAGELLILQDATTSPEGEFELRALRAADLSDVWVARSASGALSFR